MEVFQYLPSLLFVGGFPTFDQDLKMAMSSVKGISLNHSILGTHSNVRLYRSGLELLFDLQRRELTRLTYNCAHLRSTKEKKEENIWRKKIFFAEGTINGGGEGG